MNCRAILLAIFFVFVGSFNSVGQTNVHTPEFDGSKIILESKIVEENGSTIKFQFTIKNDSDRDIFIATDPIRSNGELGPYLEVNSGEKEVSVLISAFPDPDFYIYRDLTSI